MAGGSAFQPRFQERDFFLLGEEGFPASAPVAGRVGQRRLVLAECGLEARHRRTANTQNGGGLFEGGPEQRRQQNRLTLPQGLDRGGDGSGQLRPLNNEWINPAWSCHAETLPLFGSSWKRIRINPSGTVFQSEGQGDYYLAANSPLHQAGTANISPRLLAEFQHKTTYPPMALPVNMQINGDMTLLPQVPRYSGGPPDLGYWYDNLDYSVASAGLAAGTITVEPGTAIAVRNEYLPDSGWVNFIGFDVPQGTAFVSQGTPARPNTFTTERMVQETPGLDFVLFQFEIVMLYDIWLPDAVSFIADYQPTPENLPAPELDFRFSNFYLPPPDYHVTAGFSEDRTQFSSYDSSVNWALRDCSLYGGRVSLGEPVDPDTLFAPGAVSWLNNLFDQVSINLDPTLYEFGQQVNCDLSFQAYNNLFRGGLWFYLEPIPASAGNWVFSDNLFDEVDLVQDTNSPLDFAYNGYWPLSLPELQSAWWGYPWAATNASQLLPTTTGDGFTDGVQEQVLTSVPPYQAGPFGRYYLPNSTPLFGGGSRSPADAGLYHYTTRTNQVKEGEEPSPHMVNIGLHYIATAGPRSSQPKDSDGDGIADYVENWHGDGNYSAHTDTETDWHQTMTDGITPDPYSTLYDDADLSGDGLVGRIKKALGMQPFDTSNPLALTQVITGEEPDFATFEVPVSYDTVTTSGTLSLNMNGAGVTLAECRRATNGNCLLSFNVDYDPAGLHYLSAGFRLGTDPGTPHPVTAAGGVIQPFCSSNSVQFYVNASMFDEAGAFLDAQLFVQEADYTIDLYDTSTTPRAWILTITNSTTNGVIQEDWGATNADGTLFTGTTVQAVFSVTPAGNAAALPGTPSKIFTKAAGALSEAGPNFDVAYMYTPTNSSLQSAFGDINGTPGAVWLGMQAVVDALLTPQESGGGSPNNYNSSFNRYTSQGFPGQPGFPGYVTSRAQITSTLLPDLTNGLTRQFYCYAHGSSNALANWTGDVYTTAGEVGGGLGNSYTRTNLITQKPYRFVFVDGCATASTPDWARAFGIYPLNQAPRDKVGPQAFVGWAADHAAWMNGNAENDSAAALNIATAYTATLQVFYSYWMGGASLKECIDNVSFLSLYGMAPFPVPNNKNVVIYGSGYDYHLTNILTSRIYVVGHPGLTVGGVSLQFDNDKSYAPPTN